jgi:hypothetical protein
MSRQHYIPATYLASFSSQNTAPRRKRIIAQGDRKTGQVIETSAENVAYVKDLYTLVGPDADPKMVDEIWSRYETDLAEAIDKLIDRSLEANEWARILVPFIVGLLVRHPEFNLRFTNRLPDLSDSVKKP